MFSSPSPRHLLLHTPLSSESETRRQSRYWTDVYSASASRELDADVYERDVADEYDLYAREDDGLELYEREDLDLEAREVEDFSEILARAVDEVLYARATNGQGNQGTQGNQNPPAYSAQPPPKRPDSPRPAPQYKGPTKPSQSSKVKKLPKVNERRSLWERATNGQQGNQGGQANQNPPPYSAQPPPKRPDSPRPAPQYKGPTKPSQSTKVKKLPKVNERRSLLKDVLLARATNGQQGNQGGQGNQNPPPYSAQPPPKRPDSPRPAPQYKGPTKPSQSTKVKKLPKVNERSFILDWDMDLD